MCCALRWYSWAVNILKFIQCSLLLTIPVILLVKCTCYATYFTAFGYFWRHAAYGMRDKYLNFKGPFTRFRYFRQISTALMWYSDGFVCKAPMYYRAQYGLHRGSAWPGALWGWTVAPVVTCFRVVGGGFGCSCERASPPLACFHPLPPLLEGTFCHLFCSFILSLLKRRWYSDFAADQRRRVKLIKEWALPSFKKGYGSAFYLN